MFTRGFMITIILLIIQLPNPTILQAQLTLAFLTILFHLILLLTDFLTIEVIYHCKNIPPIKKRIAASNILIFAITILIGLSLTLIYLLWNLITLATTNTKIWLITIAASYQYILKPFQKHHKKQQKPT